jgi:phage shock protein A
MITIAIRVREIVSSNVDTLVSKAGEPRKMLRLLQSEIEETLIALHGDAAKARRQRDRLRDSASRLAAGAEEWTARAKIAIDHGREDLARSALLAREAERAKAATEVGAADALDAQLVEAEGVISALEAKRSALAQRIADLVQAAAPTAPAPSAAPSAAMRAVDQRIDRIDALERRAGFAETPASEAADPMSVEQEIASLQQASIIEAELAALKSGAAPAAATAKRAGGKERV